MNYRDIADKPEDDRIVQIGNAAYARPGKKIAFLTDSDVGKADRYIAKLMTKFPDLKVLSRTAGPIANVVTVVVTRPE